MKVLSEIFGCVKVMERRYRVDDRGPMTIVCDGKDDFKTNDTRIYTMPKAGTFFGIHYRDVDDPMTKLVSVIKGRGMDYVIDLREDSPTYLQWEKIELSETNAISVLIPAGIGHGFISLEDDTIQCYSVDRCGDEAFSKYLNYKDEKIGLVLDHEVTAIADYDVEAPFLDPFRK